MLQCHLCYNAGGVVMPVSIASVDICVGRLRTGPLLFRLYIDGDCLPLKNNTSKNSKMLWLTLRVAATQHTHYHPTEVQQQQHAPRQQQRPGRLLQTALPTHITHIQEYKHNSKPEFCYFSRCSSFHYETWFIWPRWTEINNHFNNEGGI